MLNKTEKNCSVVNNFREEAVLTGRHSRNKTNDFGKTFQGNTLSNKKPSFKLIKSFFSPTKKVDYASPVRVEKNKTKINFPKSPLISSEKVYKIQKQENQKEKEPTCTCKALLTQYENIIKELTGENEKLKQINNFFMINMGLKDDYILQLLNQNNSLYYELSSTGKKIEKVLPVVKGKSTPLESLTERHDRKETLSPERERTSKENKIIYTSPLKVNKQSQPQSSNTRRKSSRVTFNTDAKEEESQPKKGSRKLPLYELMAGVVVGALHKTNILNKEEDKLTQPVQRNSLVSIIRKKQKSSNHYDKVLGIFNKYSRRDSMIEARSSFLAVSNNVLGKLIHQDTIKEILKLTKDDDEFINAMRSSPVDKLITFSDSIGTLIKDYEYSINLIKRVKLFLKVSVRVVNTMIIEDTINMLIKNSCEILDCERTSIYVHDRITNMLVIHAGEGLQKDTWKIPVDKGIVGYVFQTGEKQKIDDAYLDERFNRDVDKKTGYRTRTMLCVALKNEDGKSFGVIQGLNKRNQGLFTADDEELIEVFAGQASSILKNSMKFDENFSYISRLKRLVNFSTYIHTCTCLFELTSMTEKLLAGFWSTNISQILIFDDESNMFTHHESDGVWSCKPTNVGLIGRVFSKKEIIAINSSYDNPHYNHLVDLETGFSLVTFPIVEFKNETKILAVGQLGYPYKVIPATRTIKEMDLDVLNLISSICSLWLTNFKNKHKEKIN